MSNPQTTLRNAKVIKKIGRWTIESFDNPYGHKELVVSDGWHTWLALGMHNETRINVL